MGAAEQRTRSAKAAAALKARGIFHGKRTTTPAPNSGGLTMTPGPGSSKQQRRMGRGSK